MRLSEDARAQLRGVDEGILERLADSPKSCSDVAEAVAEALTYIDHLEARVKEWKEKGELLADAAAGDAISAVLRCLGFSREDELNVRLAYDSAATHYEGIQAVAAALQNGESDA